MARQDDPTERALARRTFRQAGVAAFVALTFGGLVYATGSLLGSPFADDEEPKVHLGGREAPEFDTLDGLLTAVQQAGVPCADPSPIEDPYATYASDQVYPPTDALRCSTTGSAVVLFLYESADDRIDVYEQGVIQTQACAGVPASAAGVARSVAGANWRVTFVGADQVGRLAGSFDGRAVVEPLSCFSEE